MQPPVSKIKIAIITHGLTEWGGGVDLIRHLASFIGSGSIDKVNALILPSKDGAYYLKSFLYSLREFARQLLTRRPLKWINRPVISSAELRGLKNEFEDNFDVVEGGSSFLTQLVAAQKYQADIIFPCVRVPPKSKRQIPWVGYVLDFQHLYFPQFFSHKELEQRNFGLIQMLNEAKHIVTYSQATIYDIRKFFPGTLACLHSIPFSPFPEREWLDSNLDIREEYGIFSSYFMISNQFWVHKDHKTAFIAYKRYVKLGGKAKLVCTGATSDFRAPQHFQSMKNLLQDLGIANSVYILGHIPKINQIALLKKSLGIIQPTLFEGGPGGGSSCDAISLGVPVIASNIPINMEMQCGKVDFFKSQDPDDLSEKMMSLELSGFTSASASELWDIGNINKKRCGEFLFGVARQCIRDFKNDF
jgi:glycosyltransferase involved in cell wall biosynthesis